jgi:hypothetical protein
VVIRLEFSAEMPATDKTESKTTMARTMSNSMSENPRQGS